MEFFLPDTWEAESFVGILTNGRTKPLQIDAVRRDNEGRKHRRSVVTKSLGHPDINGNWSLAAELMGNLLAQHFHVPTPDPMLVHFSPAFVEVTCKNAKFLRLSEGLINLQPCVAAGCQYLQGLAQLTLPVSADLPHEQEGARRLFAFDMLVQNIDRRPEKTNAALLNNRVIAYDFELCFSFVYPSIFGREPAWKIQSKLAHDHIFYEGLRQKIHDWRPFFDDLAALDCDIMKQTIGELLTKFPVTQNYAEQVVAHLRDVQNNADRFRNELERILV